MADSEVRISKAISYATKALGYSELRPNQELAVKHFLRGHDVFVSLPTGSNKILCHCLLPKAFDFLWQRIESTQSIVVVVSPPSCPQISEAYVVRMGRDDALKSCLSLEFWSRKIWSGRYNITVETLRALTIKLTRASARNTARAMSRIRVMARAKGVGLWLWLWLEGGRKKGDREGMETRRKENN